MSVALALFKLSSNVELVMRYDSRARESKRNGGTRRWFSVYFSKRAESNFIPIHTRKRNNERCAPESRCGAKWNGAARGIRISKSLFPPLLADFITVATRADCATRELRTFLFFFLCLIYFINSLFCVVAAIPRIQFLCNPKRERYYACVKPSFVKIPFK